MDREARYSDDFPFVSTGAHLCESDGTFAYLLPMTRYSELSRFVYTSSPVRDQHDLDFIIDQKVDTEHFDALRKFLADDDNDHRHWLKKLKAGTLLYSDLLGSLSWFEGVSTTTHEGKHINYIDLGS